jgi:hypothetical protein
VVWELLKEVLRFLEKVYDWLCLPDSPGKADVIFVLSGRQSRKKFALELNAQGIAPTLLFSVGRFEVRRFAELWPKACNLVELAASITPKQRHFFVTMERGESKAERIELGRLGTLSEIRALASWLTKHPGVKSVVVVTSGPHLRRVRACCGALLPGSLELRYVAVPNDNPVTRNQWWKEARTRRNVLAEFPKLAAYKIALALERTVSGCRQGERKTA